MWDTKLEFDLFQKSVREILYRYYPVDENDYKSIRTITKKAELDLSLIETDSMSYDVIKYLVNEGCKELNDLYLLLKSGEDADNQYHKDIYNYSIGMA